eukprot:COSAG02_NODE_981_length_15488_cov_27.585093_6_plen_463_part_00
MARVAKRAVIVCCMAATTTVVQSTAEQRLRFHRGGTSTSSGVPRGAWRVSRGSTDTLPWHIGMNHPEAYWEPCDAHDEECIKADIFGRLYGHNQTRAALSQLQLYSEWSFTAAGYDSPPEHMQRLPFLHLVMPLQTCRADPATAGESCAGPSSWAVDLLFPDPWNATTRRSIAARATAACDEIRPHRSNLIGYIWTDTPAFDVAYAQQHRGGDWVTSMRCLAPGAPGRTKYTMWLKERYDDDVDRVCAVYEVPKAGCTSWSELDLCPVKNTATPAMMRDDKEFVPHIVRAYLTQLNTTIKTCDPEGNVFTDTIRSVWTPDNIIEVIGEFADAISYQPDDKYFNLTEMARVHHVSGGKPMLIADMGFAFPHSGYDKQEWHLYDSQEKAGAAYRDFVVGSAKSEFIVGLNKCQIVDRSIMQPGRVLKPGTLDFDLTPHQPFANLVRDANREALEIHAAAVTAAP